MWTSRFVQSLKYDAVPRTLDPIELFNHETPVTFDTMHGAESQYANCTQCNRTVLGLRGTTAERPCRAKHED